MVPSPRCGWGPCGRAPRASGDGPASQETLPCSLACSPRERGWSLLGRVVDAVLQVLPARAGMVLPARSSPSTSCPRSPRERGWSPRTGPSPTWWAVLPARAGMVRTIGSWTSWPTCAPRASGDGPKPAPSGLTICACSPRERGWSALDLAPSTVELVLPARAGMVPTTRTRPEEESPCSPRERGWSRGLRSPVSHPAVLPARAGMVPARRRCGTRTGRAPRASGDGPNRWAAELTIEVCSPRERGWSLPAHLVERDRQVLPARAGMVPR